MFYKSVWRLIEGRKLPSSQKAEMAITLEKFLREVTAGTLRVNRGPLYRDLAQRGSSTTEILEAMRTGVNMTSCEFAGFSLINIGKRYDVSKYLRAISAPPKETLGKGEDVGLVTYYTDADPKSAYLISPNEKTFCGIIEGVLYFGDLKTIFSQLACILRTSVTIRIITSSGLKTVSKMCPPILPNTVIRSPLNKPSSVSVAFEPHIVIGVPVDEKEISHVIRIPSSVVLEYIAAEENKTPIRGKRPREYDEALPSTKISRTEISISSEEIEIFLEGELL